MKPFPTSFFYIHDSFSAWPGRSIYMCREGMNHGVVRLLPASLDTVLVEQRLWELSGPRFPADDLLHGGLFLFFRGGCRGDGFAFCSG